jgi:polyphenol oxidase
MNPHWIVPDWPAPPGVAAVFTTRHGGVSPAPFDSMNLGDHVGDTPMFVSANRALLSQAVGASAVFLRQVHGTQVATLLPHSPDGGMADACVTAERQVACTILVADCLPVLLATRCGTLVGAAHAGWRGLAGTTADTDGSAPTSDTVGVLEAIFESFRVTAQAFAVCDATDVIAWLGPCIGPQAFEVGVEVKAAFEATQDDAAACFTSVGPGKFLADLPALARRRLRALGLGDAQIYGNDSSARWCTVSNGSDFFSHRRDTRSAGRDTSVTGRDAAHGGVNSTGRMAACIWKT